MIRLQRLPAGDAENAGSTRASLRRHAEALGVPLPRSAAEVPRPAERLAPAEREALARSLEAQLAPLGPHVAALDAVRSLTQPGAFAVVTGQQPGFLLSPLYCLYKALQAVRLADRLREAWRTPVVALFWNHADDHDVAEVHHTHVVNRNLDLQKISLPGLSSGRLPFSRIVLDEDLHHLAAIRASLVQIHEGAPHAELAADLLTPRHGESLSRAFTRSLTQLLSPAGLVVLEPDWIRTEMSRSLARIVAEDPVPVLQHAAATLAERGATAAIDPQGAALLFAHDSDGRRALRPGGDGFRFDGESGSRTPVELAAEIVQEPQAWSPGALLRPLVQDLCLPVAAYVGGYGELAYHAELPGLRERVGAPATPFSVRVSCTLLDPECRISLGKVGSTVERVLGDPGSLSPPDSAGDAPPLVARLRSVTDAAASEIDSLRGETAEIDPVLLSQLKRASNQVRSAGAWMAEKVERVHQNRSGKGRRHLRRLSSWLWPRGEPQERVLGPFPFLARFGMEWPAELAGAIDPFNTDSLVVHLGEEPQGGPS